MPDTPLIGLPLIAASQEQKHVTHNEALLLLDAVVHLAVISRALATPPASPVEGDRYLVAAAAIGAWAGHSGHVTFHEAGSWRFAIPKAAGDFGFRRNPCSFSSMEQCGSTSGTSTNCRT